MTRRLFATATLCLVAAFPGAPTAARAVPKLAVLIVVDQMRADYVDRFQSQWTGGLKRLVRDGAWFRRAAYPYLNTVTCAGHATVATGAFPKTHGIIQNTWWDRNRQAMVTCTADPQARNVAYLTPPTGGDDGGALVVPTFADVIRTERGGHVVTLALKARSAIMLAGHGADAAIWMTDTLDGWGSSSTFGGERALARLQPWITAHPIDADFGKTWTLLLPPRRYPEIDDAVGEAAPRTWIRTFPHELSTATHRPDAAFHSLWETSPYADEYIGRFAAAMVESYDLGKHDGTDVLGVSFSTPDLVGHAFGPRSVEVHDVYAHLDRTLGLLFDQLDQRVGRGQYVVGLSADHGVTEIPEQRVASGRGGGRLESSRVTAAIEECAQALSGPGKYVARVNGNDVYFLPGMYERLRASPGFEAALGAALRAIPGIHTVFTADQVRSGVTSTDMLLRAAALSYFEGRSGDLILTTEPGWMFAASGTTHGTANDDDQRVPVMFYGQGIKRGTYNDPATPADVVPTIATILGFQMSHADGRPLERALISRR